MQIVGTVESNTDLAQTGKILIQVFDRYDLIGMSVPVITSTTLYMNV